MRFCLLLATLLLPLAAHAADLEARVGIGLRSGNRTCVDCARDPIKPHHQLLLLVPTTAQRAIQAQLVGPIPTCKRAGKPAYAVRPKRLPPNDLVLIAIVDGQAQAGAGTLRIRAPGIPTLSFRSCTSSDGVHLTGWSGTPLHSERLWRGYLAVRYDTDPTCTEQDTAPD